MKLKILLFALFAFLNVKPGFSQTYDANDVAALKLIQTTCDPSNNLNWNTASDPGTFTGVTWAGGNPMRLYKISIDLKGLIGTLDVTGLTVIWYLSCVGNQLTGLKVPSTMTQLFCNDNLLTSLDLTGCSGLDFLNCGHNQLTSLDVHGLTELQQIQCTYNQLASLNTTNTPALTMVNCYNNNLPFSQLAAGLVLSSQFLYNPQNAIFTPQTSATDLTIDYSSEALINGTSTNFVFYKNNTAVATNTTGKYTTTGGGTYFCKMTNSLFPGLTLRTQNVVVTVYLTASPLALSVGANNSSQTTFAISSNYAWVIKNLPTWLTASATSGSGNSIITLTAAANTSTTTRVVDNLIVSTPGGSISQTITVTQAGATPALSVSPSTLNVDAAASSANTFAVTSNVSWTATSDQTWLTVSPSSGTTEGTVTVTAAGNTDISTRSATVTISGTGVTSQTVTVTQAGATPALSVSPSTLNVNAAASSANSFAVTSNVSWTATSDQAWLTISPASGATGGTVTVTTEGNTNISTRSATVTIAGIGVASQIVTVTQAGATPALSVSPSTLNVNSSANSASTFAVTSNVSWTATSDQTWLTVSPASGTTGGTVTVTASVNTNISTRSATITIAGTGVTSQTITVTQAGVTSALSVSPSTLNVNAVAGSANTFAVTSNVSWTATSDQTWLTVSPASGTTGGTVTVTATGNTNISTRSATVTIAGTGIPSQIVTVTQAGVASVLSVSPSTLNVNAAAGSSNTFTVTSNVSWTATSDQTWLTVSPVSGSNNASITLIAGANPNTSIRTATITISSTGVASKTITVTQNAKAATEVSEVSNMGNLIYPNPVKDNVNILLSDENLPATIAIYNLDGIQLLRMQNVTSLTTIDLENYLPGIYMIRIITRKGKIEKKILKL